MDKPQPFWRFLLEISLIAAFVVVMYVVLEFFNARIHPMAPPEAAETASSPILGSGESVQIEAESSPYPPPYPPPGEAQPPSFPYIIQDLYSKAASFAGAKAAILAQGNIWLVQADRQPEVLVDFGDVSVIYGWNHDDTKLLFGRGLYETSGELAKSTELWVYASNAGKAYRLIDSTKVWSASWSPVDDRVAYCEYGEKPTVYVVSLEGEVLQRRDEYFFSDLAWSPDGSAIAVNYSGPELVEYDTRYSVLGIWWLEKDELQLVSDAKREAHYFPVWLTNGSHILFTRIFGPGSEGGESGLYIVDIQTMQMLTLQNGPKSIVNRMMRSPRSDTLVFWKGYEIYIMELGKEPILIGRGSLPVWHPDGKTIFYIEEASGLYQINSFELPVGDQVIGGYFSASTIHLQPNLFFQKDINP